MLLKDKETTATVYPIFDLEGLPDNLLLFLTQEYNDEIARGDTQPFFDPLTLDEFRDYWFGQFGAVMVLGDKPKLDASIDVKQWATKCLGAMFIKSCYPGRSAHVCTGNFLVNAGIRRKGIGTTLAECFLTWAPRLGYSYALIELIFETNMAARRMLERLHFKKVGRVKGCGLLKSTKKALIDSLMYGRELQLEPEDEDISVRHEHIRRYLTSGQYPEGATRQEKSRLRALAYHYSVHDGKLYLKGKEVISSIREQYRIAKEIHERAHLGINKTTTIICEHYHWPKVKETVTNVIKHCPQCKDPACAAIIHSQVPIPRSKKQRIRSKMCRPRIKPVTAKKTPVVVSSTVPPGMPANIPFVKASGTIPQSSQLTDLYHDVVNAPTDYDRLIADFVSPQVKQHGQNQNILAKNDSGTNNEHGNDHISEHISDDHVNDNHMNDHLDDGHELEFMPYYLSDSRI